MDNIARKGEIENMIRDMNRCWTAGWHEELFRQYIHPDAVAIIPTTPGRLEGRDAYVAGWRGFAQAVVIHEWRETDHKVQVYTGGKSAVVTYFFRSRLQRHREADHAGPGHGLPCEGGTQVARCC